MRVFQRGEAGRWGKGDNRRGREGELSTLRGTLWTPSNRSIMELYLDLLSSPCRAVYLFAEALKIPYEFKSINLFQGQQYTKEFGELSIIRKVPVLKDDSFVLTESIAILQYLAQKCSVADQWFPADLQQGARVNEYLSWQHLNLRLHCSKVTMLRGMYPFVMGSEVPKEKMDAAMEDMKQSLDLLEEKFLQNKQFIIGSKISLADLVAIVEMMRPLAVGVDVFEDRPKLLAWRDRVKKELGEKLFDQAHEALLNPSYMQQKMPNNSEMQKFKSALSRYFR
ncbi:glutathione S-transferase theta-3-like [Cyprinodon tularosa]|uniref:glutathione S-transferase theta-3-like n=1 Tax=Cyprinodon tularosa TaxID=77115 RepID=UPI0018E1FF3E|nr:glutathione S-transferase theta-3-like [Cyprinodon tularosa]